MREEKSTRTEELGAATRPCLVCGAFGREAVHRQDFARIEGVTPHHGYTIVKCETCGMLFADGIPEQAAFDEYYAALSKYESPQREGEASPADAKRFRETARDIVSCLEVRSARVVDIGCSTGGLLAELKKLGIEDLLGIDPSPKCAELTTKLHSIPAWAGTFFNLPKLEELCDVAIFIGVLEHVREAKQALTNIAQILKPDGALYIEVPDAAAYDLSLGEAPFQEFSIEHINFFTARSLTNLLEEVGFAPVSIAHPLRGHGGGSKGVGIAGFFRKAEHHRPAVFDGDGVGHLRRYVEASRARAQVERALVDQLVARGESIAIWGAGTLTCRLLATTDLGRAPISAFIDSNSSMWGKQLANVEVRSPEWLRDYTGPIVISSWGYMREITETIRERMGLKNQILYVNGESLT